MLIDYTMASNGWDARSFKPGDILDASYEYTAKIPHFYLVTRVSASSVWARELGKTVVQHDGYGQNGKVIPNMNVKGEEVMARIKKSGYLNFGGYRTAHIWDGKPVDFYTD